MPNAFAIGRSQKTATVCATTGIMKTLSPSELEGVMAHELTHVKNRDVLIMTVASFFASVASMILQFSFFFGGGDDDDGAPAALVIFLVSLLVYVVSFFLILALSRYRESRPIAAPRSSPAGRAPSPRRWCGSRTGCSRCPPRTSARPRT